MWRLLILMIVYQVTDSCMINYKDLNKDTGRNNGDIVDTLFPGVF